MAEVAATLRSGPVVVRNALVHRVVDRSFEGVRTSGSDQYPRGMLGHGFLEGVQLPVRIVSVRAGELGLDAQRPGGVLETHLSLLPVRQSDVGRDKNVAFVFLVEGLLA